MISRSSVQNWLIEFSRFIHKKYQSGLHILSKDENIRPDTTIEDLSALKPSFEMMGDLGYDKGLVKIIAPDMQQAIWEMRKQGLNIIMSMKGDGKPISFVEDCAVSLDDLPDYTARLEAIFRKYNTYGTWYAHASVGTLHVRPVLNLKLDQDVKKMRAIAEEAFEMVREYKGSHSGEHGDRIVRSEFHKVMFGDRIVSAFGEVKRVFDPGNRLNPGRIVNPPRMDCLLYTSPSPRDRG